MQVGLLLEAEEGLSWRQWRQAVAWTEALGFESVWISDHLLSPWSEQRYGLDAWAALTLAAAESQRVRLGPLVSPVTFREPVVLVRMAEALQTLSGGRFVLGLGLGWNDREHQAFGVCFPPAADRARRLEAAIQLLHRTLDASRPPLLIGGMGARWTLPLVARYADEWNLTTASASVVRERSAWLERLCEQAGREPGAIRRSVAVGFLIGADRAELRARSLRMQMFVPPLAGVEPDAVPAAARGMGWVAGTPSEVVAALRDLAEAGVERVILGHYDVEDRAALELIAAEVLPQLA